MIQYFQLTPEILLEFVYEGDPKLNEDGIRGNEKDLVYKNKDTNGNVITSSTTMLLKSDAFTSKYFCFKNETEGLDSISNLVLPLNNTETQFVVAKSTYQNFFSKVNASNRFTNNGEIGFIYEDTNYDKDIVSKGDSCDVKYDKCIVHFTSRNYFGSYDSLIFQAYVYMKNKAKLYFASFLFKKTSNLELKAEHLLYNEKLYTTQIEFDIPSAVSIFSKDNEVFNKALEDQNIELLQNTPIGINLYGVNGSVLGTDNYEKLKTLKINSISIPYIYNGFGSDEICVDISEAQDGDYYYIDPQIVGKRYSSFVEYIESMGEDIRAYMVMHELCLKEVWVDDDNVTHSEITHKEFHIIDINEDDEDEEISKRFDAKIKYRPICIKDGKGYIATIIDKIKIINTIDNSSYEVTGSLEISNPYKYGKRLKRLELKDSRPIVNVYNKAISTKTSGGGSVDSGNTINKILGKIPGKISGSILTVPTNEELWDIFKPHYNEYYGLNRPDLPVNRVADFVEETIRDIMTNTKSRYKWLGDYIFSVSNSQGYNIESENEWRWNVHAFFNCGDGQEHGVANFSQAGKSENWGYAYLEANGGTSAYGKLSGKVSGNIPGMGTVKGSMAGDIIDFKFDKNSNTSVMEADIEISISASGNGYSSTNYSNGSGASGSNSGLVVLNKGGGFSVENMSQNITSFIESTNVGISVINLTPEDIN